ncbi:MAG TPA: HD domain-containing protein [Natronosporangium sp.]
MKADVDVPTASLQRLVTVVRREYMPDSPTHDHSHLARVAALAATLCRAEGGNEVIVHCAAWLHDLHREARPAGREFFVSPEAMDGRAIHYLEVAGIPGHLHAAVLEAIHYTDRYSFSDRPPHAASLEARCVRDADNLDAIGAIGVARTFAFGGSHDIPLFVDEAELRARLFEHDEKPASTIHHFYDKLLRLPGELETPTARRLGERRGQYLKDFVRQFMWEWDEDFGRPHREPDIE